MQKISAGNLKHLMLLLNFRIHCKKPNLLIWNQKIGKKIKTTNKKWTPKIVVEWKFGDWGQEVSTHLQQYKNYIMPKLNCRIIFKSWGFYQSISQSCCETIPCCGCCFFPGLLLQQNLKLQTSKECVCVNVVHKVRHCQFFAKVCITLLVHMVVPKLL